MTIAVAPAAILSVYKKDWVAELANQPGQELLKAYIYKDNVIDIYYNHQDPNHKRDRVSFYNRWKKRKEKDQRTYLSVSSVFNNRMGLEIRFLGIEYETDAGCILAWNLLNLSFLSKSICLLSSMVSVGYNFSKLLYFDNHKK